MNRRVELIYDRDCPNVAAARSALLEAFRQAGLSASWIEWDRKAPDSPAYAREYGSPTILVDGKDVAGIRPGEDADCCRLYGDGSSGFERTPAPEQIVAALSGPKTAIPVAQSTAKPGTRAAFLAAVPGVGALLLPVGICPACWPVYAGILGSLGVGFLLDARYLFPLAAVFLGLAIFSLAWQASSRRGYGPLCLGLLGGGLALVGKFAWHSDPLLYLGAGLLVGGSLWNSWPRRAATAGSCAKCAPQNQQVNQ